MSKKKNKKNGSEGESSSKAFRKLKKKITRLLIIATVAYVALGLYNPQIIDYPPLQEQFINLRSQSHTLEPHFVNASAWIQNWAKSITKKPINSSVLSAHIENLPEEVVVEQVVSDFSKQVKDLPATQIQKIKAHICEDIVGYQLENATITPITNPDEESMN